MCSLVLLRTEVEEEDGGWRELEIWEKGRGTPEYLYSAGGKLYAPFRHVVIS